MNFNDPVMRLMAINNIKNDISDSDKMQAFFYGQNPMLDLFSLKRSLEEKVDLKRDVDKLKNIGKSFSAFKVVGEATAKFQLGEFIPTGDQYNENKTISALTSGEFSLKNPAPGEELEVKGKINGNTHIVKISIIAENPRMAEHENPEPL